MIMVLSALLSTFRIAHRAYVVVATEMAKKAIVS